MHRGEFFHLHYRCAFPLFLVVRGGLDRSAGAGGGVPRGVGGVFIAPDAAPLLPPFAVVKGGVDAQSAGAMQKAVATEMRRTALKGSFAEGGRSCKHVFRFLDEWGSRSVAHKCMNDIFDQVMPLARTFCTDRYISLLPPLILSSFRFALFLRCLLFFIVLAAGLHDWLWRPTFAAR